MRTRTTHTSTGARPVALALACATALAVGAASRVAAASDVADAAMNGDHAALRTLIDARADVNEPQIDGATALHWAVYRDDVEAVDLLLAAGADVHAANRAGATPLGMASLYGYTPIIERLLAAGADPNEQGPNGETPIMMAARNGSPEAVNALVAAGADVNARERLRDTTALMWAAEQRHPEAVRALLDAGADYSARSGPAGLPRNYMAQRVNTANVKAAYERRLRAIEAGRTYQEQVEWELANGLLRRGRFGGPGPARRPGGAAGAPPGPPRAAPPPAAAPPAGGADAGEAEDAGDTEDAPQGQRPAPEPPEQGDNPVVIAGLVGTGGGGLTPLVFAAREGDLESARALVDAGAEVNEVTNYGWSPLLVATNNRNYRLGEYLIDHGADVNLANKGGWTPLYLATDNRNIEGGDYPVPQPDMDHLEFIRILLDHGADPNVPAKDNTLSRTIFTMQWFFEDGATPFIRAAQSSDTVLMNLLLDHGADPLARTAYGDNALTAAAGIGWVEGVTYERSAEENVEAIGMLLDLGLDPNEANQDGRTPLMGAALKGRSEVVELLVEHGAKLDQHDYGSRDTDKVGSLLAGHTWQAVDYADGLVRVGVQSAVARPETAALIRRLMEERGMKVPPPNRVVDSICVVEICQ